MRAWVRSICIGLGVSLAGPLSAVTTSTFQVNAQIVAGCLVVGGVSAYGVLNFGTRSALYVGNADASLGGTAVTFQCTPGVAMSMSLDGGQNSAAGSRNLKRGNGTQVVPYQLFQDVALTQSLAIGQSVTVSYSNPAVIKLPLYARAQLSGKVPAGTYTDVVQVTVTW